MNRFATFCTTLALALLLAGSAVAQQQVTIREINDLPDDNIAQLMALGGTATIDQITELTAPPLLGQEVSITAVVLTDPFNSGLATPTDGVPGRIHIFVRDAAAETLGYEGMGMQVVDGSLSVTSLLVGDIVNMTGTVNRFGLTIQFSPSAFEVIGAVGPDDPLLQPVVVTTDEVHNFIAASDPFDRMQFDWSNFEDLNNQFVRFENAQVVNSIRADEGRPGYLISSPGTETLVDSYDLSLRYRNDRVGSYNNPPYNTRDDNDPFIPPPAGAFINLDGFLVAVSSNFNYPGLGQPNGAVFSIAPSEDDDLEVLVSAPIIGTLPRPMEVLGDGDAFTVSTTVVPDPTRTVADVELVYEFSSGGGEQVVPMTNTGGDTYEATIPAAGDGVFVTYFVRATDSEGLTSESPTASYRVLFDGINDIEDVQLTANAGAGSSPFVGFTGDVNIDAVVMSDLETSGFLIVQDDESLAPWSGVFVEVTIDIAGLGLQKGDRVTITNATVGENFNVTELQDATLTVTGSGEPYGYKVVPTGVLAQDNAVAEAHEGMALRFENVTVTHVNADGPDDETGFGEFQFSSDGSDANQVRADDSSDSFPATYNIDNLTNGQQLGFVQGLWWFSFGNYKLLPESPDDIGTVVSNEDGTAADGFTLESAYPNPFEATTTIRFTTAQQGPVVLAVYDIVGRRVATLVDGDLAAATHTVTLDGRGLAGGTYVVRLQAGDRVSTQKLVLVK